MYTSRHVVATRHSIYSLHHVVEFASHVVATRHSIYSLLVSAIGLFFRIFIPELRLISIATPVELEVVKEHFVNHYQQWA